MGPKIFHASTFNHYGYDLQTVSIVLQKVGDMSGTHRQLIHVLRTRQYNSSDASPKINVLWKSIKVLLFKGRSHTHTAWTSKTQNVWHSYTWTSETQNQWQTTQTDQHNRKQKLVADLNVRSTKQWTRSSHITGKDKQQVQPQIYVCLWITVCHLSLETAARYVSKFVNVTEAI